MDAETRLIMNEVADQAARKAVSEMLTQLGIDHTNPIEMQKDMAALREIRHLVDGEEFQADLLHVRRWRKAMDAVQSKGILAAVGLVVTGVGVLLWIGFQQLLGKT